MATLTRPSGRRARASAGRMKGLRAAGIFLVGVALGGVSGGLAFFLPAIVAAAGISGQAVRIPTPSAVAALASPTPAPAAGGPFTVLLLGSDDDEKFDPAHVLTQSMILVRVDPAARQVTML